MTYLVLEPLTLSLPTIYTHLLPPEGGGKPRCGPATLSLPTIFTYPLLRQGAGVLRPPFDAVTTH